VGTTALSEEPGHHNRWRFYLYCRQYGVWPKEVTGHDPHTEPKWFDPYCPVRNVTKQYPPTFLVHGTNDHDVPYSESKDMAARLKEIGVEHELITVPGAGHGLQGAKPQELERIDQRAIEFLRTHTM
jgi:dipeptidyl aminopeptidase/acylaminoacyl peptidase